MGGRCAVPAAVVIWFGVMAGAALDAGGVAWALGASVPFAWLAWRAPDRVGTVALLVALTLTGAARGGAHARALETRRTPLPPADRPVRLEGRIVEPPPRAAGEPIAIVRVDRAEPALVSGSRLRLRLPAEATLEWGDRVRALARLERPAPVRNPGGRDGRAFADASAITASGRALVARAAPGGAFHRWPRATAARWRRGIEARLVRGLTPRAAELVVPLVVGDRSALPTELDARLRAAGLIHLLALSGLHVVWLASLARAACAALGRGPRARAAAGAACAVAYGAIAGPLPSLVRAAAGEVVLAAARLAGRALDPVQGLALSALALLALAPGWARDVGFQLSCAATLGLLTVGPWLGERLGRWRAAGAAFVPTLSAQVTALPILLANFHALSWVGVFANLAAVPVCGLLLTAAWLAVLLEYALPGSAHLVFGACEWLALGVRAIAGAAAAAPGAMVCAGAERGIVVCAGAAAMLLALALAPEGAFERRATGGSPARAAGALLGTLALALTLGLMATAPARRPPRGTAWLVVLDVGQGDALALGFPDGWWLVDAGPRGPRFDAGESVVVPFLRWVGVRRLERLVLTHDDGDHTGGAGAVGRAFPVGGVLGPRTSDAGANALDRFGARAVQAGDTLRRDPWVIVRWPPSTAAELSRAGPPLTSPDNAAGVVLEVGEGRGRALLLADVDSLVEARLGVAAGVGVLKVAHHGSGSSSGGAFLDALRARHAAVSAGARNRFGHPAPAVLARLGRSGARIERTDQGGALWYALTADGVTRMDWRRDPPPMRAVTGARRGGPRE